VQVAPRQTTLDATTWWIVDLNGNEEEEARTQHGGGGATPLVRRCMRVHGWTETQTRRVLKGYRQFLRIKAKLEDWTAEQLAPSASVGLMWQQHILDANNYFHDCMLLCGHVVGHDPDSVLLSDEDKMLRREATVNALLEYYNERDVDTVCVWRDIFHPEEKPTKTGGTTLETQESSSSEGTDYTTRTRGDLVCSDEQDLAGSWDLVDSADCCAVEDRNASTFEGSRSSALVCHTLSTVTYPTNVEVEAVDSEAVEQKRRHIDLALDQCESMRLPCKKKLMLNNLSLTAFDIPLRDLCGTSLGDSLRKLSLAGNPLGSISTKLVCSLPALKILDLSQCELTRLPDKWNLPQLTRLNLSHNRLTEFPEEVR
jgi:Leucine-rich repeat (LRR) protein